MRREELQLKSTHPLYCWVDVCSDVVQSVCWVSDLMEAMGTPSKEPEYESHTFFDIPLLPSLFVQCNILGGPKASLKGGTTTCVLQSSTWNWWSLWISSFLTFWFIPQSGSWKLGSCCSLRTDTVVFLTGLKSCLWGSVSPLFSGNGSSMDKWAAK